MKLLPFQEDLMNHFRHLEVDNPHLEVRWILESVGLDLWSEEISEAKKEFCLNCAKRRARGEPLAYILGIKGFYKDEFAVQRGVLIPRPETELLVLKALEWLSQKNLEKPVVYDFGCGSGCVGLSILRDCPNGTLFGFDIEEIPIKTSHWNSEKLGLSDKAHFQRLDVGSIPQTEKGRPNLIVANPPYIDIFDDEVCMNVRKFEPPSALFAEEKGLAKIKSWSIKAKDLLVPGGFFVLEFGKGQEDLVEDIFRQLDFKKIEFHRDLAGITRCVSAEKESE